MPNRPRIRPVFVLVAIAGSLSDGRPAGAEQGGQLQRPPRARVATLPRSPNDKPQETAVAVSPKDPSARRSRPPWTAAKHGALRPTRRTTGTSDRSTRP